MHHEESFFADPRSWVAIAFVLFFVLFGKKIWTILTGLLDKRADTIRAELAEAQRLRTEAEAMLADAAKSRTEMLARATELLEGAKREAARLANEAAAEAAAAAQRRERMAMERIATAEKSAIDQVRLAAADVATQATKAILAHHLPADVSMEIVNKSIAQMPAALRVA
jgi:F-type H+-transporting ATPase subunit b